MGEDYLAQRSVSFDLQQIVSKTARFTHSVNDDKLYNSKSVKLGQVHDLQITKRGLPGKLLILTS